MEYSSFFYFMTSTLCGRNCIFIFLVHFTIFSKTIKVPHGFDKSADLLSNRQNHEEDLFKLCVLLKQSEL